MPDHRYLQRRRQGWYVRVRVPADLVALVGQSHVVRSLNTRHSAEARAQRWLVLGKLHEEFVGLRGSERRTAANASAVAERRKGRVPLCHTPQPIANAPAESSTEQVPTRRASHRADRVGRRSALPQRAAQATTVPEPEAPGLAVLSEAWFAEVAPTLTKQTVSQHKVALRELFEFLGRDALATEFERRTAGRFITERLLTSGRSRKTVNRLISSVSAYWTWLVRRGHCETNPWHGQFIKAERGRLKPKRPYTEDELRRLLRSDPVETLGAANGGAIKDLMRLGLVTGARLNELCELRVEDLVDGGSAIAIRDGKTVNARRVLPLHRLVQPLIARRVLLAKEGLIFPELKPGGPDQKRSWYISKRFTEYRRRVLGEDDTVDFHSFRRSFATFLERASMLSSRVNASVIAELMGHAKPTLALSLYSGGLGQSHLVDAVDALTEAMGWTVSVAIADGQTDPG